MPEARRPLVVVIPVLELRNFEGAWPRWLGAKDEAIRAPFRISSGRYFQLLHRAIGADEAVAARPVLVHRLRRLRDAGAAEQRRRAS